MIKAKLETDKTIFQNNMMDYVWSSLDAIYQLTSKDID